MLIAEIKISTYFLKEVNTYDEPTSSNLIQIYIIMSEWAILLNF